MEGALDAIRRVTNDMTKEDLPAIWEDHMELLSLYYRINKLRLFHFLKRRILAIYVISNWIHPWQQCQLSSHGDVGSWPTEIHRRRNDNVFKVHRQYHLATPRTDLANIMGRIIKALPKTQYTMKEETERWLTFPTQHEHQMASNFLCIGNLRIRANSYTTCLPKMT